MKEKFSSIRYLFLRSHLSSLFLMAVVILSLALSVHVLFQPAWLTAEAIFFFLVLLLAAGFIISVYSGFTSTGNIKVRLDHISVLITQFANGNYLSSVHFEERDEIGRIGKELNELGEKLQAQVKSLQRMADEKAEFASSAHKAAVIEERQRLARDLHDAVSQQLFALTMMSEAAVKQLDRNPEKAKTQIREVAAAALKAQTEMRALLLHLRPIDLSGESLKQGVAHLIEELQQKSQIDFRLATPEELVLSRTVEEHVFRIIQESLSNILRHADATEVTIELTKRSNELFLYVRDNGRGFDVVNDAERKTSYGLKTMRERSEELGGTFTIRSSEEEGTYIDIRIPC
ncbi:sensor histidine kinase [Lentibacillus sediminis]|uniref:sensor histidine kinase n=1 Tax=Lentibacillus sediminis TaxID=1940529 RepID=UPI000C1BF8CB|nr:sensor histidine kinase [Lentibacillus sediminis]